MCVRTYVCTHVFMYECMFMYVCTFCVYTCIDRVRPFVYLRSCVCRARAWAWACACVPCVLYVCARARAVARVCLISSGSNYVLCLFFPVLPSSLPSPLPFFLRPLTLPAPGVFLFASFPWRVSGGKTIRNRVIFNFCSRSCPRPTPS